MNNDDRPPLLVWDCTTVQVTCSANWLAIRWAGNKKPLLRLRGWDELLEFKQLLEDWWKATDSCSLHTGTVAGKTIDVSFSSSVVDIKLCIDKDVRFTIATHVLNDLHLWLAYATYSTPHAASDDESGNLSIRDLGDGAMRLHFAGKNRGWSSDYTAAESEELLKLLLDYLAADRSSRHSNIGGSARRFNTASSKWALEAYSPYAATFSLQNLLHGEVKLVFWLSSLGKLALKINDILLQKS